MSGKLDIHPRRDTATATWFVGLAVIAAFCLMALVGHAPLPSHRSLTGDRLATIGIATAAGGTAWSGRIPIRVMIDRCRSIAPQRASRTPIPIVVRWHADQEIRDAARKMCGDPTVGHEQG